MLLHAAVQHVHQVVVDHEQGLAERHRRRPEHCQGDGSNQQDGGDYREGALGNHMNSFSFFQSV